MGGEEVSSKVLIYSSNRFFWFLTPKTKKKFFTQPLNGRLPLKHGSDRSDTLGKRVSDDFAKMNDYDLLSRKIFSGGTFLGHLKNHLPSEDGSVRLQTLGKRVSDDPRHPIFRHWKTNGQTFDKTVRKKNVRLSTNCLFWRSYGFLDVIGRCAMKNDPRSFDFLLSTAFGRGVKVVHTIFGMTFGQKWFSHFLSLLKDTRVLARRHLCPL